MEESVIVVDVQETIRFFDEVPTYSAKQATSIVSIVGEDLATGCFQRHIESKGATVCVRYIEDRGAFYPESVTEEGQRNRRLDRWIVVDCPVSGRTAFQTEIKNSSAHAYSGKKIARDASTEDLHTYKLRVWRSAWDEATQTLRDEGSAKVLLPMKIPCDLSEDHVKSLLICWTPMAPKNELDSFLFQVKARFSPGCDFKELWVFSISSYLRSLDESEISLKMPMTAARYRIFDRLFRES